MPDCAQCTDADLGRICPHQGPGLALWEQGRAAGRAEVAAVLLDLIAELKEVPDYEVSGEFLATLAAEYATRLREVQGLRRPPSMWQFRPEHPAQGDFWLSPVRPFVQVWDGEKWIEVQGE